MTFKIEDKKFVYTPSTKQIYFSLSSMQSWSELLLKNSVGKPYTNFLEWLVENKYFMDNDEPFSTKQISKKFGETPVKITKWISLIYEDILKLNEDKSDLFKANGISVTLYMRYFDNTARIDYSLSYIPRIYELFEFYFIKAKVGTDRFWVKKIEHCIENDKVSISIFLYGGAMNKYREMLLQRAEFEGNINFMEIHKYNESDIDEKLLDLYR